MFPTYERNKVSAYLDAPHSLVVIWLEKTYGRKQSLAFHAPPVGSFGIQNSAERSEVLEGLLVVSGVSIHFRQPRKTPVD